MTNRSELRSSPSGGGGSYSSGCFPAGTLVDTPEGTRDISALNKGDIIRTVDDRGNSSCRRVLKVSNKRNTIWQIVFADGNKIRTTASHSFRVNGSWKRAGRVTKGDALLCVTGAGRVVTKGVVSSEAIGEPEEVFNIVVQGKFTFIADGVLAHSFTNFRSVRMFWWTGYSAARDALRFLRPTTEWEGPPRIQSRPLASIT